MLDRLSPKQIQENVRTSARNVWLASLGAVASVEQESSQLFDELVSRGRELEKRRRRQVEETLETAENEVESVVERLSSTVERRVAAGLERVALPTRDQMRKLTSRVESLSRLVDRLDRVEPTATAAATPSTPAETRKVYHVTSHEDGWKVQAEGAERASRVTDTKAEAVAAARELAQNQEPSQVVVHRLDGTIQTHYSYGETADA